VVPPHWPLTTHPCLETSNEVQKSRRIHAFRGSKKQRDLSGWGCSRKRSIYCPPSQHYFQRQNTVVRCLSSYVGNISGLHSTCVFLLPMSQWRRRKTQKGPCNVLRGEITTRTSMNVICARVRPVTSWASERVFRIELYMKQVIYWGTVPERKRVPFIEYNIFKYTKKICEHITSHYYSAPNTVPLTLSRCGYALHTRQRSGTGRCVFLEYWLQTGLHNHMYLQNPYLPCYLQPYVPDGWLGEHERFVKHKIIYCHFPRVVWQPYGFNA
jgi:hypothetical protein